MMTQGTPLSQLFMSEPENDWRADAVCKGMDPEIFFSPDQFETKQDKDDREAVAKEACGRCPVREPCLDYSYKAGERYGIWGGLTEQERRALARRRSSQLRAGLPVQ
ncbi:MAG TPA: WhiB family transcriptional regulator [Actinomycetota bacterium]|nr:WhiB family transcriptional regulator [Actinomycetota bacterium]